MSLPVQTFAHTSPRKLIPLPDSPEIVISSRPRWQAADFSELWAHRELLYFLTWRDIKVRYKQTALGIAWVVLQPLLMTIVFTVFLGRLVQVPSDGIPYPLFAYAGLMVWTFFSSAVSTTGNSLTGNAHLITKIYFPRLIIPMATIAARLVDLAIGFIILLGMLIYYRVGINWGLLLVPVFLLLVALLALGFGLWTSALNVKYRDVGLALPVLIQIWMFVSPVVYPMSIVPQKWRLVYSLNPLVGIIEGFRAALFGSSLNWISVALSTSITLAVLLYAVYAFRNRERTFADLV